ENPSKSPSLQHRLVVIRFVATNRVAPTVSQPKIVEVVTSALRPWDDMVQRRSPNIRRSKITINRVAAQLANPTVTLVNSQPNAVGDDEPASGGSGRPLAAAYGAEPRRCLIDDAEPFATPCARSLKKNPLLRLRRP